MIVNFVYWFMGFLVGCFAWKMIFSKKNSSKPRPSVALLSGKLFYDVGTKETYLELDSPLDDFNQGASVRFELVKIGKE